MECSSFTQENIRAIRDDKEGARWLEREKSKWPFSVDDENYTFLLQDFCFHIMSPNKKYISKTIKPDENGLLHATTYDAHSIATYIAESTLPIHECLNENQQLHGL